jgi:hypothetical protein
MGTHWHNSLKNKTIRTDLRGFVGRLQVPRPWAILGCKADFYFYMFIRPSFNANSRKEFVVESQLSTL